MNNRLKQFLPVRPAAFSVHQKPETRQHRAKHLQVSMNKYLDMVARPRRIVAQNEVAMTRVLDSKSDE